MVTSASTISCPWWTKSRLASVCLFSYSGSASHRHHGSAASLFPMLMRRPRFRPAPPTDASWNRDSFPPQGERPPVRRRTPPATSARIAHRRPRRSTRRDAASRAGGHRPPWGLTSAPGTACPSGFGWRRRWSGTVFLAPLLLSCTAGAALLASALPPQRVLQAGRRLAGQHIVRAQRAADVQEGLLAMHLIGHDEAVALVGDLAD